jgi:hypothetical protein
MDANAVGSSLRKAICLVVVVEAFRQIAGLTDVDERVSTSTVDVCCALGDYIDGSDCLEVGAPWIHYEVVAADFSSEFGIGNLRHQSDPLFWERRGFY